MIAFTNVAATAAIKSGPTALHSVILTGGSDAATVILYNNTAGSGTVICKLAAAAGTTVSWSPPKPLNCQVGIYATITGTAPSVTVAYG